jgi:hypothetical protein
LPQLPYLEELGVEGNRIVSFAHAPCLPSLVSVNITGKISVHRCFGSSMSAPRHVTRVFSDNPVARLAYRYV